MCAGAVNDTAIAIAHVSMAIIGLGCYRFLKKRHKEPPRLRPPDPPILAVADNTLA